MAAVQGNQPLGADKLSIDSILLESGDYDKQNSDENVPGEVSEAVKNFLAPLKRAFLSAKNKTTVITPSSSLQWRHDPSSILDSLSHFIWEPNLFYVESGYLLRLYSQLSYTFNITSDQSDLEDLFDYKPYELMATKASQLFILLAVPNPSLFLKELSAFQELIEDVRIRRDGVGEAAYAFLYNLFRQLYSVLADEDLKPNHTVVLSKFHELPLPSQCVVEGLSVLFIKLFKIRVPGRTTRMQRIVLQDSTSAEWCLILGEILRLRRRESCARNKWATPEEMGLLGKAYSIAPDNPFVRLAILDTIIGNVRDSSGRFYLGDIHLDHMEDSMRYLYENCIKLTEDFPNNVSILSVISDYFARYFPHMYFDADRALALLESANKLNPSNPKTTHRFGILHRMSFGNCTESLKWLQKTIELDPTHYQGTFEYFKTLLGKLDEHPNVATLMTNTLQSPASDGWNDFEMAEFLFILGIAHYINGNKEETLKIWDKCAAFGETMFSLEDVLTSTENFQWDYKHVNVDKIKLWIQSEQSTLKELEKNNDPSFSQVKKDFIDRLFSIMLGFKIPKRPKPRDFFEYTFPQEFYDMFAFQS